MQKSENSIQTSSIGKQLNVILVSLLLMFVSGTGMTSIGRPTKNHVLSAPVSILWHSLLAIHLAFCSLMIATALLLAIKSITKLKDIKKRAIIGVICIVFGMVNGMLVLAGFHAAVFLFLMALSFLMVGAAYGPMGRNRGISE